jgi:hypothetical protein
MADARDSKRASAVGLQVHYAYLPHPIQSAAAHWERVSRQFRRIELDAKHPAFGLNQESRIFRAQSRAPRRIGSG